MLELYLQTPKNQTQSKMTPKPLWGLMLPLSRFFTKIIENYAELDLEGCTLQPLLMCHWPGQRSKVDMESV